MAQPHKITMLGTGFIADFYTLTLHNQRGPEQVHMVYSRSEEPVSYTHLTLPTILLV